MMLINIMSKVPWLLIGSIVSLYRKNRCESDPHYIVLDSAVIIASGVDIIHINFSNTYL